MENKVDNGESGRRRFIRRLTTLGAAGGIATLLYGRVNEKPLIQFAQAASGDAILIDEVNTGSGTTELDSTVATKPVLSVYATATSPGSEQFAVGGALPSFFVRTDMPGTSEGPFPSAIEGYASATSGITTGVYGASDSPNGYGIYGNATATSGLGVGMKPAGVHGETSAAGGDPTLDPSGGNKDSICPHGVEGVAHGTSGTTTGVFGESQSPDGTGVQGSASAPSGRSHGVWGSSNSPDGIGIEGNGGAYGVLGSSDSPDGVAVKGENSATSGNAFGVYGQSHSPDGAAVEGENLATSGNARGVSGDSNSPDGAGVVGSANATNGSARGVAGFSNSPDGAGVEGGANATSGDARGVSGWSNSPDGAGVTGTANATSGSAYGVMGFTSSPEGQAIQGHAFETSGQNIGVAGYTESPQGIGVQGITMATTRGSEDPYSPNGVGVSMGVLGFSNSPDGIGVRGACVGGIGVWGATHLTPGGVGVYASAGDIPIDIPLPPYPTGRALVVDGVVSFSTAGAGLIPAKSSSVDIADKRVTASSHVTITFTDNPGKNVSVQWIARKPGVGFTVNLTDKVAGKTSFTYLIVEPS